MKIPVGLTQKEADSIIYEVDGKMMNKTIVSNRGQTHQKLCKKCGKPMGKVFRNYCPTCIMNHNTVGHIKLHDTDLDKAPWSYRIGGWTLTAAFIGIAGFLVLMVILNVAQLVNWLF